jgi:hypothetical protein
MVARFVGEHTAEMTVFVGASYFAGFDLVLTADRTVSVAPVVMKVEGDLS